MAAIDHLIVKEGDMLHQEKVLKIEKCQVILEKDGSRRVLKLTESQLPLKVKTSERGVIK